MHISFRKQIFFYQTCAQCSNYDRCFSPPMHWLIFESNNGKNGKTITELKKRRIFLNADISYINFGQSIDNNGQVSFEDLISVIIHYFWLSRRRQYQVFDIYNNGYDFGGKLQIIFDRYFTIKNNTVDFNQSNLYPKTVHRKFLNDISVKIGIPVTKN